MYLVFHVCNFSPLSAGRIWEYIYWILRCLRRNSVAPQAMQWRKKPKHLCIIICINSIRTYYCCLIIIQHFFFFFDLGDRNSLWSTSANGRSSCGNFTPNPRCNFLKKMWKWEKQHSFRSSSNLFPGCYISYRAAIATFPSLTRNSMKYPVSASQLTPGLCRSSPGRRSSLLTRMSVTGWNTLINIGEGVR